MEGVQAGLAQEKCLIYLNDILVHSQSTSVILVKSSADSHQQDSS